MMKERLPWIKFYTDDWLKDTRRLTPHSRGVWIDLLCRLWPEGQQTFSMAIWCREISVTEEEFKQALLELKSLHIGIFIDECNGNVTVISRRMLREATSRKQIGKRVERHRETLVKRSCNADVTVDVTVQKLEARSQKLEAKTLSSSSPVAAATSEETKKVKRVKSTSEGATLPALATSRSADTWEAYRRAYTERYQVEPVRNASVNAILLKFVGAVGQEEAPMIAAFYLQHNEAFYVKKRHPVSLLLHDATGLRTQWATGVKATTGEAKNAEFKDNVVEQVKRIEALRQGERT
jgi:hypothetical protein